MVSAQSYDPAQSNSCLCVHKRRDLGCDYKVQNVDMFCVCGGSGPRSIVPFVSREHGPRTATRCSDLVHRDRIQTLKRLCISSITTLMKRDACEHCSKDIDKTGFQLETPAYSQPNKPPCTITSSSCSGKTSVVLSARI